MENYILSFTIRITHIDDTTLGKFIGLHKKIPTFAVQEVGKKTGKLHYQSCFDSNKKLDSHQTRVRRRGFKGNEEHSAKMLHDKDGWLDYLCKGERQGVLPKVVINTMGISDEEILMRHNRYWDNRPEPSESTVELKAKSNVRKKELSAFEKLYEYVDKNISHVKESPIEVYASVDKPRSTSLEEVAKHVLRYYRISSKHFPSSKSYIKNQILGIYMHFMFKNNPGQYEDYENNMADRLCRELNDEYWK